MFSFKYTRLSVIPALSCLISVIAVAGCGWEPTDNSPFVSRAFDLNNRQFSIKLPPKASIQSSDDKKLVMISLQPYAVTSPQITLRIPFSGDAVMSKASSIRLNNSARLNYNVSESRAGNGKSKAFLNGQITLAGARYIVSCNIQSKYVTIEQAAWCVNYLGTLAIR